MFCLNRKARPVVSPASASQRAAAAQVAADHFHGQQAQHDRRPGWVRLGLDRPVVERGDDGKRQDGEGPGCDASGEPVQQQCAHRVQAGHQQADGQDADAKQLEEQCEQVEDARRVVGGEVAVRQFAAQDAVGHVEEVALVDRVDPEAARPGVEGEDAQQHDADAQRFALQSHSLILPRGILWVAWRKDGRSGLRRSERKVQTAQSKVPGASRGRSRERSYG